MVRECDNDDCDYETDVDSEGRPYVRWVHIGGCPGLVEYQPPDPESIPGGSFAEYLLARGWPLSASPPEKGKS